MFTGALTGAGLGVPLLAVTYLGWQALGLPFAAFDLFTLAVRLLPGQAISAAVEVMVAALHALGPGSTARLAKYFEGSIALALFLMVLALLGALYGAVSQRRVDDRPALRGAILGIALWSLLLPLGLWAGWQFSGLAWTLALSLAWGVSLGLTVQAWAAVASVSVRHGRRQFLARLSAGALAVSALGLGLGWLLKRPESNLTTAASGPAPPTPLGEPDGFSPVPGARSDLTPVADFYRVDIKLDPPRPDIAAWRLEVGGLVDRPLRLSYVDLSAMRAEDFYATLECISNSVGGNLISTTWFTGVPLREVLDHAGLQPGVLDIKFTCADGYSESLPLDSALHPETRLCLAMGGAPLTPEHGFPVRLFTPNRFGMKNPKWIVKVEALAEDYLGFWEKRGWSEPAWVKTTSVIDASQAAGPGALNVGGIAYAGARGISRVEARVDDGEWIEAELKPPLSGLSWVLWRAHVIAPPGRRRLTVRATDGDGALQTERRARALPNGATGYHSISVNAG